ncbi:MAG: hypothetical protein JWN83_728 [Chitinophagaceae bacterium]|nr:hypothetical protein [Chitinophagaceae bacterium]
MQKNIWKKNIFTCMFGALTFKEHQNEQIKKSMRLHFLLFLFTVISLKAAAQEPNKLALIVAISKYPASSGWGELSSLNDVKLIKDALLHQGFKEQNITVITDKQATLAGISTAMDQYLVQKAQPGDIAVFHFSGHGQQIEDDNGDEGDGLDESFIPYDAPAEFRPGPDKHFRDDLLGQKLSQLRTKLGDKGNLLVIIDACHSGTMTRGGGRTRGTSQVYASPAFKTQQGKVRTLTDNAYNIINDSKGMAPMACFFASSPQEQNQEAVLPDGTGAGSLSLAFSRALAKADKSTSYRGLFDDIKLEMSSLVSQQTPLAEGDLDYTLFGGKAMSKPAYYLLQKDEKTNILSIPVGKIFGIFGNTTLKLYKADTRDTAGTKPLATGIITNAGEYASEVKLDKKLTDAEIKSAWVYLDEINYGDLGVKVKLNVADAEIKKNLIAAFNNIRQATLSNEAADLFLESGLNTFSGDSIYLVNSGQMIIWQTNKNIANQNLYDTLAMKVGDYARAKYLRNLSLANPEYKVSLQFVPLKCVANCDNPRTAQYLDDKIKSKMDVAGNIFFKNGDKFRLNIINHSDQKRLYYTIVDIQPDNQVNVLIPGRRDQPEDFLISQEDTIKLEKIFTIGPPYGVDVLKIIASDVPLDLRNIFESRGKAAGTRGRGKSPFEKIVEGTYNAEGNKKRGPQEEAIQPDAVNIMTVPFHIVKKDEVK